MNLFVRGYQLLTLKLAWNLIVSILNCWAHSCQAAVYPIYLILKKSLQCGQLSAQWKESLVIPLFKKGSRYSPLNYRPINLTSVCCKTLERQIAPMCMNTLIQMEHSIIIRIGFRRGSTVDGQLLLTYDVGFIVDVVLFAFVKSFDVVSHHLLLYKLRLLNNCSPLIDWIANFLNSRAMKVSGIHSSFMDVRSGVLQGSV